MDRTVIYYTSNREEESFEKKIRELLLENMGDIPLISVSQKPIDFGENICVGEHTPSNLCIYKQLLIGCKKAVTPFVINAESDFLYPPEYFKYVPTDINKIYRYKPINILWKHRLGFWSKQESEGAQMAGREYLISILESKIKDVETWKTGEKYRVIQYYRGCNREFYGSEKPCVSFKTESALHKGTGLIKKQPIKSVEYWGSATSLRKKMFN